MVSIGLLGVYRGEEPRDISALPGRPPDQFSGGAVVETCARMDTAGLFVGILEVNSSTHAFLLVQVIMASSQHNLMQVSDPVPEPHPHFGSRKDHQRTGSFRLAVQRSHPARKHAKVSLLSLYLFRISAISLICLYVHCNALLGGCGAATGPQLWQA